MVQCLRKSVLGVLLASTVLVQGVSPARAGDINSSEALMIVSVILVVSAPLAASAGLKDFSEGAVRNSTRGRATPREKARALPPMEVKDVKTEADGAATVQLQVPGDPQQVARLQWPAQVDSPAAAFVVGQQVHFIPTATGSGWNLHDAQGTLLAYAPTAYAAGDNDSALW